MRNWHFRTDALYLLAMLVVILAFLAPAWRQPESIWYSPGAIYSDLTINHWPNWWLVKQSLRQHGQVPLWRSTIMSGAPFVGNPQARLFYPPNWLLLALPLEPAFHVLLALHLDAAGAALYGLARRVAASTPFAAFVAGLSYALTPKLIAHVGDGHIGLQQAMTWLPLSLLLLHKATTPPSSPPGKARGRGQEQPARAREGTRTARASARGRLFFPPVHLTEGGRARHAALACGATLTLTFLADPYIAVLNAFCLATYGLYRTICAYRVPPRQGDRTRAALRLALHLVLVPLSALAFGAVQALPTLELMRALTRSTLSLTEAGFLSLPWRHTIGYLLADWGGYSHWMTYLGLVPLGLGLLALLKSRAAGRWFWLGLAAFSLLYALGLNAPLFPVLYRLLPALGWIRTPSRALLLVVLSSSVLVAYGVDALLAGVRAPRWRYLTNLLSIAGLLACAGLGLGFAWLYPGRVPPAVHLLSGVGTAASLAWFLSQQSRIPRMLVQALLVCTLVADLSAIGHSFLELRSADAVANEGLAAASWAATQEPPFDGPYRVYSPSFSIPQQTGARLGLEQVDGVDPIQLRWVAHYVGLASGCPAAGYGVTLPHMGHDTTPDTACQDATPDARLLGLLNACFVVAEYPLNVPDLTFEGQIAGSYTYRNERCLPRAFVMKSTESISSWQDAQARLADGHDPAQSALVESDQTLNGPPGWQPATIQDRSPNHLAVYAETAQPALLVLGETGYPGWQATIDGIEQPIVRVNGIQRGVYLDPGSHTVVWRYRPASLTWGALITVCALAGWLLLALLPRYARRREAAQ